MRTVILGSLFLGLLTLGCSRAPTPLNEEEFLKVLAEVNRVGPLNFRRDVWPLLEKKTVTYCGPLAESKVVGTESVLLFEVDKTYEGKKLPWVLEGKSASLDLAPSHKVGEAVCITGIIESFQTREPTYWGYVKIQSVEKQRAS
jgi:hypothetical protein